VFKYTVLALGLAIPIGAHAQQILDEESDDEDASVISVTANRLETKVQDTPSAVTVVDKEALDRIKFTDAREELMKRIPGYSMSRNLRIPMGSKNYTINLIDGLSMGSTFGSGSIGFADDVNTFDIERVEVIRGPASALYGSNALGGVINVITREPPLEPEYRVWAEAGQYSRQRAGVSAGGTAGTVGYFLDANILDSEGAQERTESERKQLSGKLLFAPSDNSMLTLRAEYLDTYLENPGRITQTQYNDDWLQAAVPDAYTDEQVETLSAKYELDLTNRSGIELSYGLRNTDSEGPPSYSPKGGFSSRDVTNQNMVALYRHRLDTLDSQFIVGTDFVRSVSDSDTYTERNTSSDIAKHWDVVANNTSPFAQYEFSPHEKVRVSLGARYDRIRYSAEGYKVSNGVTTEYDESTTFTHTSPKAGVTFKLDEKSSLWFGYGQGFVVPSSSYLFVGSWDYDANPDLDPEQAENYEIGFRGQYRPANLSYDFVLYHTTIEDMLVADDDLSMYVNAGEVRVRGLETMASWAPLKSLRFDLTHTYADNKYLDFTTGTSDYSGHTLAYSPKHHIDLRTIWMPIQGLEAELEWNRTSKYYTSTDNSDPEGRESRPSIYNLRVSYNKGHWSYWGHILNLTDKKYAERVSYSSKSDRTFDIGSPRTIYAGVAYNW
jgi:outer membrane receptor protein involved in Fe transport